MGQETVDQNGPYEEFQMIAVGTTLKSKRIYSKEFLLSVAELEECQRVPVDLDTFLLRETPPMLEEKGVAIPGPASSRGRIRIIRESECCESPPDMPEWRRSSSLPGSPFLKSGSRHVDTKISSPRSGAAQGNINLTRSIMGRSGSARWELHSNGDDRDRDAIRNFFEWDSSSATESGGHMHNKRLVRSGSVISQEHDGLLGSGGPLVQRSRLQTHANDRHRPERTSRIGRKGEQVHSTGGAKNHPIIQSLGWEDADSVSHETFGSDDQPNEERSEQERQRRDQFEQMRKELQKKPLNIAQNHNDTWLGESLQSTEPLFPSSPGTPHSTSSKDDTLKSFHKPVVTSSTPRLLVPPGFSKPLLLAKENHEAGKRGKDDDTDSLKKTSSNEGPELDNEDQLSSLLIKLNQFEDENQKTFPQSESPMMSKFARWFPSHGPDIKDSPSNSVPLSVETKSEDLDLSLNASSAKLELAGSCETKLLSKLKSVTSLIPSNSKGSVLPMPVGPSLEDVEKMMTAGTDSGQDLMSEVDLNQKNHVMLDDYSVLPKSSQAFMNNTGECPQTLDNEGAVMKHTAKKNSPVVLTCEDLEHSFLTESVHSGNQTSIEDMKKDMDSNVNLMQLLQMGGTEREDKKKDQGQDSLEDPRDLDGRASEHIMSLLQKTSGRTLPLEVTESSFIGQASEHLRGQDDHLEDRCDTSDTISLETLFGRKFVNELRSVAEPVSAKQIADDSKYAEKDDSLQSAVYFNNSRPGRAGHADAEFHEQVGWKHNGHAVKELEGPEILSGSSFQYLQDNHVAEALVDHHLSLKTTKNLPTSRGVSGNGASFGDLRNRNISYHPYRAHKQLQVHPTSEVAFQRLHVKPIQEPHLIHDRSIYGMGMYAPSSLAYGQFPGAGNSHVRNHFEGGSPAFRGSYRMPSSASASYPESIQMGFNASQGIPDPRLSGARFRPLTADRWFPGGFHPYQHLMAHERKPGPGVSGLAIGPGAQSYSLALPSDSLGQPEISYDQYMRSNARPGYG